MKDYRALQVWQRSHRLTLDLYAATRRFPKEELFGLTSQMRRSAASIPSNLAEGCGRDGDAELRRFVGIAHGSASEPEYFLLLAAGLGYLSAADHDPLAREVSELKKMLGALSRKLGGSKLKADR
jgi:four helix bundle protein